MEWVSYYLVSPSNGIPIFSVWKCHMTITAVIHVSQYTVQLETNMSYFVLARRILWLGSCFRDSLDKLKLLTVCFKGSCLFVEKLDCALKKSCDNKTVLSGTSTVILTLSSNTTSDQIVVLCNLDLTSPSEIPAKTQKPWQSSWIFN